MVGFGEDRQHLQEGFSFEKQMIRGGLELGCRGCIFIQ